MFTHAVLAALTILASPPTSPPSTDGWKDLTGETAPAIEAVRWFNAGDSPTADLAGKVVLLEFFATW